MDERPVDPSIGVKLVVKRSVFAGRNVLDSQNAVNGGFLFPGFPIAV